MTYRVAALYRFVPVSDLSNHQAALKSFLDSYDLCGTLLIAPEGVNGTIASSDEGVDRVLDYLDRHFGIRQGEVKFSSSADRPFQRFKVRLKKEIVTLREPKADPKGKPKSAIANVAPAAGGPELASRPDDDLGVPTPRARPKIPRAAAPAAATQATATQSTATPAAARPAAPKADAKSAAKSATKSDASKSDASKK